MEAEKITLDDLDEHQEYVPEIASIGIRFASFLIDLVIYITILSIMNSFWGTADPDNEQNINLEGFPAYVFFAIIIFLYPISEGRWGQTLGKRICKIEVKNVHYAPIGYFEAFVKNIVSFLDYFFFIGLFVAIFNKRNQRIADLVAGTVVVKKNRSS